MFNSIKAPVLVDGKRHLLEAWVWVDANGELAGSRPGDHYLIVQLDHVEVIHYQPVPLLGLTTWVDVGGRMIGINVARARGHLLSVVLR
jgi:hypothetical protein